MSLRGPGGEAQRALQRAWQPSPAAWQAASLEQGRQLYRRFCATCHQAQGATRLAWQGDYARRPTDLATGPYRDLDPMEAPDQRRAHLARIAKYGISSTDMPGHEYLPDENLASLALWLSQQMAPRDRQP